MKKIYSTIIVTLILIIGGFGFCFGEDNSDYDETKSSINSYIDDQLEKINLEEIQGYIDESLTLEKVSIKSFIKDLISGDKTILDLFDKEGIKLFIFSELKSSLKVATIIFVLALLSSILKSLDNSFSSGAVSQITTYIIYISMISLTLVSFKNVLEICNSTPRPASG